MIRGEILQLSGIDLSAAIADKVFGGPQDNCQWYWWRGSTPSLNVDTPIYAGPKFHEDWSAMGLLVEHMIDVDGPHGAQKWSFGLEYSSVVDWVADFTPRRNHPKSRQYPAFQAQASTAPVALARAALLAVCGEEMHRD